MWINAPIPETSTSIIRLRSSKTKPNGTVNTVPKSIHFHSGAERPFCSKTKQLQRKLPRTAATEIKLLNAFNRRVNKVIAPVETSGRSRTIQGKIEFIRSARELRESTQIIRKRHLENPCLSFALSSQCVRIPASGSGRNLLAIQARSRSHADNSVIARGVRPLS